jgi:death-on-curing protein
VEKAPRLRWVQRLVVEAVQLDVIREHGGMPGLRDEHALQASLARAQQRHAYGDDADLADMTASYGYGLCRSHPFDDGNKRIAFVTMAVFLGLNGHEIEAPETEVVAVMTALAAGELDEADLVSWLRSRMVPTSASQSSSTPSMSTLS